jgi:hypothetical protein
MPSHLGVAGFRHWFFFGVCACYALPSRFGVFAGIGMRGVHMIEVCLPIWVWRASVIGCFVCLFCVARWRHHHWGNVSFYPRNCLFDFLFVCGFGVITIDLGVFIKMVTPLTLLFFVFLFFS